MKHRYIAILLCAALLLGFTGCGSKERELESTPASTTASAAPGDVEIADETTSSPDRETAATDGTDAPSESAASAAAESTAAGTTAAGETQEVTSNAEDDQEGDYNTLPPVSTTAPPAQDNASAAGTNPTSVPKFNSNGKLHVTVQTVEITEDALKSQDYTVPLLITLDKNPGINYSEWGLHLDDRCTYTADNKGMDFSTVYFINEEKHFLWTAWTSGADIRDYDGTLLTLNVTLPSSAKAGDSYIISYADWSLADAAHIWQGETNWVSAGEVGWTDGGITVK